MKYDVWLSDDGTLDTVIEYTCPDCGEVHECRYDADTAAEYRDPRTGELNEREFFAEIVIPDLNNDECPNDTEEFEPAWDGRDMSGAP